MKRFWTTVYIACLLICSTRVFAQVDAAHLSELRKITKAKHLYFRLYCNEDEDDPARYFAGWAAYVPMFEAIQEHFAGEGKGFWVEFGRTQQEVAVRLIKVLKSGEPPDIPPGPKTEVKKNKDRMEHQQCPPEISGDP